MSSEMLEATPRHANTVLAPRGFRSVFFAHAKD